VTILLMVVLLGFTLLAAPHIKLAHYGAVRPNWGQALTLWMVSFVGLEITASFQGEMRQQATNAPRALLLAPLLAAGLGAAIVAVSVGVVGSEWVRMCVTVIPVGLLRNYVKSPPPLVLPCARATIEALLQQLAIPSELVAIALVNGLQQPKSYLLAEGDVVKLMPLMGGG